MQMKRRLPNDSILTVAAAADVSVVEAGHGSGHRAVECNALLDQTEVLGRRLHPGHIGRIVLGFKSIEGKPNGAVIDANPVANFSPQQLVDW